MAREVPINLAGRIFPTNLIILPYQRIDIIFGMNWMKAHGVVLDTQAHAVHINSSAHGSMVLLLTKYKTYNPAINKLDG